MAYNDQDDFTINDNFGVDTDIDSDSDLIDEELTGSVSPSSSTKDITLASEEDKNRAKDKGKAETADEKAERILSEKRQKELEAEEALRKEVDADLNSEGDSKPPKKDKEDTSSDETSVDDNDIVVISEGLYKAGIFTRDDEDEEAPSTQEEFLDKFNSEKEKAAEQLVYEFAGKYGEDFRDAFNAMFVDGVSPKEYLSKFEEVQSFKDMDLKDEDNQVKVVEASLRKQGWDEVDIKEKIKSLKLNSELESDALKYHKALVRVEEADLIKTREREKAKQEQKRLSEEQYKTGIRSILADKLKTKEFDGIPVTKEDANKTLDFLDNKKWKLPSGELITDWDYTILELNKPQNYTTKVKLGLLLSKIFQPGKPIVLDLGPVAKTAVSRESSEIFNFGNRSRKKVTNKNTDNDDDFKF